MHFCPLKRNVNLNSTHSKTFTKKKLKKNWGFEIEKMALETRCSILPDEPLTVNIYTFNNRHCYHFAHVQTFL